VKGKILYLEGRPNAHPLHRRLAESLGCDIDFIDASDRWQDKGKSPLSNVISWFRNAKHLAKKYHNYDVFLIDNLHFTPVIMNMFFARPRKKMLVHLGSHTLFFMKAKKFSAINLWLHKEALKRYNALICEGTMARNFVAELLAGKAPATYVTFLGTPKERLSVLKALKPNLESTTIVIIANGPSLFRLYYKGLDVMIKAFSLATKQQSNLQLKILGTWSNEVISQLLEELDCDVRHRIFFEGSVDHIDRYFSDAGLCLHCTRGDAFPTSTLEAMTAGIPVILSEFTGTKEVLEQVDTKLITTLDEQGIADKIIWYYNLSFSRKQQISLASRSVAERYTESQAIIHYRSTFDIIYKDLGILRS